MCKIMVIPDIKNSDNVKTFMQAANVYMSAHDQDGVGYAAVTNQGDLIAERWRNPELAFTETNTNKIEDDKINEIADCLLEYESNGYNATGQSKFNNSDLRAVIFHSRFATCEKTIENLHPFIKDNTALIHNGVISKPYPYPLTQSSCDSETILNGYLKHDIVNNPKAIQDLADSLKGYFALGVLAKTNNNWILDIIKDDNASLAVAFVKELDTLVYCTNADIIRDTCEDLNWTMGQDYSIQANTMIRYDVSTGKVLTKYTFQRSKPATLETNWKAAINARDYSDDFTIDRKSSAFNNFVLPPEFDENDIAVDGDNEAMMRDGTVVQKITIDEYLRDNSSKDSIQYIDYNDGRPTTKWIKGHK